MLRTVCSLLVVASLGHATDDSYGETAPGTPGCDTTGTVASCARAQLTEMPKKFHRETTKIDLSHNGIKEIVSQAWSRHTRARRDWTSPCNSQVFKDVDNGYYAAYGPGSADTNGDGENVAAFGDKVPGIDAASHDEILTTFPSAALQCLLQIYELAFSYNNIADMPALGTGGLGLTKLGILMMDNNLITSLPSNTFTGLGASLKQVSFANNRITKLMANTFDSTFVELQYLDLRSNYVSSFALNFIQGVPTLSATAFMFNQDSSHAGNVLYCPQSGTASWFTTVSTSCVCNRGHAQFPSGGSEFNDIEDLQEFRACRVGPTALSEVLALKELLTQIEAKVTTIEGYGTKIDGMVNDTTAIKADLTNIHLKLDAAGCPGITRRFRRDYD